LARDKIMVFTQTLTQNSKIPSCMLSCQRSKSQAQTLNQLCN
jgi:hypothetical protein